MKELKFNFTNTLASLIVVLCFAYFYIITLVPAAAQSKDAGDIKTALVGIVASIISYYWGSSRSGATKDETISNALKDATNK